MDVTLREEIKIWLSRSMVPSKDIVSAAWILHKVLEDEDNRNKKKELEESHNRKMLSEKNV